MNSYSWEEKQIIMIRKTVDSYFHKKCFTVKEILKNTRDGGYVGYTNKIESLEIKFFFLPSYEIEILYHQNLFNSFFGALFRKNKKSDNIHKIIYLSQEMNYQSPINTLEDYKLFIEKALVFMEDRKMLIR